MGFLGKLRGGKPDYPSLDSSAPAAKHLDAVRPPLHKLAHDTKDPLEIVPADNSAYIFVGKPTEKFGILWIEDRNNIVNFKSLVGEKGLSPTSLQQLSEELKKAYIAHQDKPRFVTRISDREVGVIPATSLLKNVKAVVNHAASWS